MFSIDQTENGSIVITDETDPIIANRFQPTSGSIKVRAERFGKFVAYNFVLNSARMAVTRNASGSYASIPLFQFAVGADMIFGVRQNYTAFAESAGLSASGNASFVLAVGQAAQAAVANGVLGGTQANVGSSTATITNSGGTGSGRKVNTLAPLLLDSNPTQTTLYLNWSGTTASVIANGSIDVTGEITFLIMHMGK